MATLTSDQVLTATANTPIVSMDSAESTTSVPEPA